MKKTFVKISALSISMILLASSCTKPTNGTNGTNGATGATGATGPALTGTLQGLVFLYNVDGTKMLPTTTNTTVLAGDSVFLTNNSSGAVVKTITNNTGAYSFANVTTGTYSLTISKPLFGTVLSQSVQFAGGGIDEKNYALSVIPTTNVVSAASVDTTITPGGGTAENYVKVRGYVPVSSGVTTVIVYVSLPANTSATSTPGYFSTYYTATVSPGATKFSINIPTQSLYDLGFPAGSPSTTFVYFSAYILGGNTSASEYADMNTGEATFTAVSNTPVTMSAPVQ